MDVKKAVKCFICSVIKGHWGEPIPATLLGWRTKTGREANPPKLISCEHPKHQGKRKRFPLVEMYYQRWELTEEKLEKAVKKYEMRSLEPFGRFICRQCKEG